MKIAFTLRPRPVHEVVSGLLIPGKRAARLFTLVDELALPEFPEVFATADGFLVKLAKPRDESVAGVINLRSLAAHLFLPVDADLIPPLLGDEAQSLVRDRGLVFLPGGRVLEFVADRPLALNMLLAFPRLEARDWRSLPEARSLADDLVELVFDVPSADTDQILEQGRTDIGTEAPRPAASSGLGSKIVGGVDYFVGATLAWLGTKLGARGLVGLGGNLLERALRAMPRLSERLMGKQDAALRELVRDFQKGNIERALRRALPLNRPLAAGLATNARLPKHTLFYSLQNLLGGRNTPGAPWATQAELYYILQLEYRKQAEAAARNGDYRRAAFIYAKLLNDLGSAAHMLSQGGLHRDAAIVFDAIPNREAAAGQWQAAGEIDKAVEIYVQMGADLKAADALSQVGDTSRALVYYRRAAQKLTDQNKYVEAGNLLLTEAQRPDLALVVFHDGWKTRPQGSALPCGLALANHFAQEANSKQFLNVLADSQSCFSAWNVEAIVHFLNHMTRLSHCVGLASIADDAQDRCLLALAEQMQVNQQAGGTSFAAARYFPADSPWPTPVFRDAQFALGALVPSRARNTPPTSLVRLGKSTVRAVCYMRRSMDLFLGLENGEIIHYHVGSGETHTLARLTQPVVGLAAGVEEEDLVALSAAPSQLAQVFTFSRQHEFRVQSLWGTTSIGPVTLCATLAHQLSRFVGVLAADSCTLYRHDNPSWSLFLPWPQEGPRAALIGYLPNSPAKPFCLVMSGNHAALLIERDVICDFDLPAPPENPSRNTLLQPPLFGWLDQSLWVYWVTKDAGVHRLTLTLDAQSRRTPGIEYFHDAKQIPEIHGGIIREWVDTKLMCLDGRLQGDDHFVNPVAAFRLNTREILVVEAGGEIKRMPEATSR
jgi:tetratricopeptide (TPR) repeat protein